MTSRPRAAHHQAMEDVRQFRIASLVMALSMAIHALPIFG